jgi:hypothetical protein
MQDFESDNDWQKLETVMTAYIDLIKREKVIAIHKDLEYPKDLAQVEVAGEKQWLPASQRPGAMVTDPATGRHKPQTIVEPWILVPYTDADLQDSLKAWSRLVKAIHDRIEPGENGDASEYGLVDHETLAMLPDGFAKEFLTKALKPHFKYIAPGLQVPTAGELDQPTWLPPHSDTDMPPLLLFRGEGRTARSDNLDRRATDNLPVGLYLEQAGSLPMEECPANVYEDACRLILPFELGYSYTAKSWAKTADWVPFRQASNDTLYQIGGSPYTAPHQVQLKDVLVAWAWCVDGDYWKVDASGVKGGIEKFREADTEEHFERYITPYGPLCGTTV